MPLTEVALNTAGDAVAGAVTYIALVDGTGVELTGGGYARQAVTWTAAAAGLVRPTADLTFSVAAGVTVGGWRGYTTVTAGTGVDHGGADLINETYAAAGTYVLQAAGTAIDFN